MSDLIDKAEAHDDDLIRRGDALAAVKAHDFRWEAADAIAATDAAQAREAALREAAAVAKEIADQYVGYMGRIERAILALIGGTK